MNPAGQSTQESGSAPSPLIEAERRNRTGRQLTVEELERVLRRYPGDVKDPEPEPRFMAAWEG
jgi:hypothetical protein